MAVGVLAGDGHEQRARPRRSASRGSRRVTRDRRRARLLPAARPSRRVPRSRPSAARRAMRSAEPARVGRLAGHPRRDARVRSSAHDPGGARRGPPGGVAPRPDDPFVRAGHLDPLRAERALVLVQPEHRVAVDRLAVVRARRRRRPGPSPYAPSRIASWIARQRSRCIRPGWSLRGARAVRRVDGRQALAVAVQEQAAERRPGRRRSPRGRRAGRGVGGAPPVTNTVARPEPEAAPPAGRLEQRVEAVAGPRRAGASGAANRP